MNQRAVAQILPPFLDFSPRYENYDLESQNYLIDTTNHAATVY